MIILGDCIEKLRELDECSVDSIVTDPPYGIAFMGKTWDSFKSNDDYRQFSYNWAKEAYRVLKPGGYLLSFSGTRTYHWMAVGIEQAGFSCRDMIEWIYGSGFPKSHNISKAIDRSRGAEREIIGKKHHPTLKDNSNTDRQQKSQYHASNSIKDEWNITSSATNEVRHWDGYGTALKPAQEPIMVAQKPILEKTIAENCVKWNVGALNIEDCKIGADELTYRSRGTTSNASMIRVPLQKVGTSSNEVTVNGRWPANVIHDGSDEVIKHFCDASFSSKKEAYSYKGNEYEVDGFVESNKPQALSNSGYGITAARFFYCAKTSTKERKFGLSDKNDHPTVKPITLMRYLVRLVTPHNGVVLDPFMGSGSTGVAAMLEGKKFIGIEMSSDYFDIAETRINNTVRDGILPLT